MQKDSTAAEEERRKLQEEFEQKEERNKMQDAEMAELRSLQAGEERRGSTTSQTGDGCLEALGANGVVTFVQRLQREMERHKGTCQEKKKKEDSEDEQEQDKAGSLGEGGEAGKSGKAKDERKRPLSNSPSQSPTDEEEDVAVEETFGKTKKKKREGKDPRTFDENSQGRDFSTPNTNSQGEDQRTF